ncbi:hypothetical protein COCNU_04G006370 [Cocos nucifera]|uniref:Uncharacterized protein n=1 Tax=Cocos nucifera TaxID=13894 RepID=A0A8K0N080_COCNU|nr:hypothetical protein COCNU_04G006370 [Cocos nucifera]
MRPSTLLVLGRDSSPIPNGQWGHIRTVVRASSSISSKVNEAFDFARVRMRFSSSS